MLFFFFIDMAISHDAELGPGLGKGTGFSGPGLRVFGFPAGFRVVHWVTGPVENPDINYFFLYFNFPAVSFETHS